MRTMHLLVLGHLAHHDSGNSAIEWTCTIWCAVNGTICTYCKQGHLQCDNISKSEETAVTLQTLVQLTTLQHIMHIIICLHILHICMPCAEVTCTRDSLVAKERRPCWPQSAHLQPASCVLFLVYFLVYHLMYFLVCLSVHHLVYFLVRLLV